MPYLNRYAFIGNLTRPPLLRLPPQGNKPALCILHVAINRDHRDEEGERQTRTTFVNDIEVWGATGEACAHFLTQGSMVLVEGRMEVDQWQDKASGAKRSRLKVVAENVQFLRIKRPEEDAAPALAAAEAPAPIEAATPRRRPRSPRRPEEK